MLGDTHQKFTKKALSIVFIAGSLSLLAACSEEGDSTVSQNSAAQNAPANASAMQTQAPILSAASSALGMDNMQTLSYSGSAWRVRNSFRQTLTASAPWPQRDDISNYQRTLDLSNPASRATGDTFASNLFLEPPVAGTYSQNIAAEQNGWAQQLEIWLTPWGFIKGAEANGATQEAGMLNGKPVTVVTWQSPASQTSPSGLPYTVKGYIDGDNLIRQVETWVEDAFMGDMHVVALYKEYQQLGGRWIPRTMEQQRGGGGVFGLVVDAVQVNPANAAELLSFPPAQNFGGFGGGQASASTDPLDKVREVAPGVHLIEGSYVAMAVEFADHIAVFEAGGSESNGQLIVDAVNALHPNKELRYLINSHPHSDHTAGMVPVVRAGATVVTHQDNVDFMRMALSTPRTLAGEETMTPQFFPNVGEVTVMEDSTRRLELHQIKNLHSVGTIVAYLPNEGILFQADFTLPQGGAAPNPFVINLANYVDQNGLQFEQYLAVHAAQEAQSMADLMATIGK